MSAQVIDGRGFVLRHVAPTASWPSEGGTATVLGRTYGFTVLPMSHLPTSPDLVEGSYTGRLGDAGEFSLTFPNVAGSKGLWRERFSADLSREFIEIYRDEVSAQTLEFVGSIQRVEIDRGVVTVSGTDAWALLRRAYEQDRHWTAAPQEVATAYTRVPVPVIADDHDDDNWTTVAGSVSFTGGQMVMTGTGAVNAEQERPVTITSDTWRMVCKIDRFTTTTGVSSLRIFLRTTTGTSIVSLGDAFAAVTPRPFRLESDGRSERLIDGRNFVHEIGPMTIVIERKGRWVYGYVNGQLVGIVSYDLSTGDLEWVIRAGSDLSGTHVVYVDSFLFEEDQQLLARGSDLGDYVLPTDQPTGGLRGRYFNDADLENSGDRVHVTMAPNREPYGERLDPIVDTSGGLSLPLQPGNSGDWFAVRWFGSVYLRGDLGDYTFEVTSVLDGVRLWVGKTAWGDHLIQDWTTSAGTNTAVWDASDHGSAAGWYPLVLELFVNTGTPAIRLQFTPPGSTYTDPGGTSITASTKRVIPATSLSPLGCYDNRVQGASRFDLVQGAAQQFGYQLWCEPMQLESGEFPGRLVPRLRVGRDTDVVLEVEDRPGVEPALSPGVTIDGADQAVALIGTGGGLADGSGSQVSAEVYDLAGMADALFSLRAFVDAADIAFPDLLAARLSAELGLRATPWEEVRATPRAQEQLADTWPLSQTLAAMRWRPGDALRLIVPDIGVEDTSPRQMLQVTRAFAAGGRTATQVAFRQRPRSAARSVRSLLRSAIASQRSYQGQRISLPSNYIDSSTGTVAASGYTRYTQVALYPGDRIVRAFVRLAFNSAAQDVGIEINGTDRTSALEGPWSTVPVEVDIARYATQVSATDNRLFMRLQNQGGSATAIEFQLFVEVLR